MTAPAGPSADVPVHAPARTTPPPLAAPATDPAPAAPLAWLVAVPGPPPRGVHAADVGRVAWQVLLRDGVLQPLWGDLAAPAGTPPGPVLRAAAVRLLVPPRAVLGRAGAVWVHTGGPAPARFDVLVEPRARRPSPHPARVPHECPLPAGDVQRLGETRVTTVLRTALDVARWLEPPEAGRLVARLVAHAGLDVDVALRSADRRVRARLQDALAAQERPAGSPAALDPVIR